VVLRSSVLLNASLVVLCGAFSSPLMAMDDLDPAVLAASRALYEADEDARLADIINLSQIPAADEFRRAAGAGGQPDDEFQRALAASAAEEEKRGREAKEEEEVLERSLVEQSLQDVLALDAQKEDERKVADAARDFCVELKRNVRDNEQPDPEIMGHAIKAAKQHKLDSVFYTPLEEYLQRVQPPVVAAAAAAPRPSAAEIRELQDTEYAIAQVADFERQNGHASSELDPNVLAALGLTPEILAAQADLLAAHDERKSNGSDTPPAATAAVQKREHRPEPAPQTPAQEESAKRAEGLKQNMRGHAKSADTRVTAQEDHLKEVQERVIAKGAAAAKAPDRVESQAERMLREERAAAAEKRLAAQRAAELKKIQAEALARKAAEENGAAAGSSQS